MKLTRKEAAAEAKKRGFHTLNYKNLLEHLEKHGWRKQSMDMHFIRNEKDGPKVCAREQRLEWWNRGPELLVVHADESDGTAIVFTPTTVRRATTAVVRERPE